MTHVRTLMSLLHGKVQMASWWPLSKGEGRCGKENKGGRKKVYLNTEHKSEKIHCLDLPLISPHLVQFAWCL